MTSKVKVSRDDSPKKIMEKLNKYSATKKLKRGDIIKFEDMEIDERGYDSDDSDYDSDGDEYNEKMKNFLILGFFDGISIFKVDFENNDVEIPKEFPVFAEFAFDYWKNYFDTDYTFWCEFTHAQLKEIEKTRSVKINKKSYKVVSFDAPLSMSNAAFVKMIKDYIIVRGELGENQLTLELN